MERNAIYFGLLGPVEAAAGGRVLELGGRRQRALLALLLLDVGRAVTAGRLAEELWHGAPPPGAEGTLRTYVSRLRRVLGADTVEARAGGYGIVAERSQIDVHRFELLVSEGRAALARGAAGFAADRLRAALALWRAPALADVADGGALAGEAHRLDELRLSVLEDRIEADLALGRHVEVVTELQALVESEPLRERAWCLLALALYRSERQADALEALREARTLLVDELGLEPGEELRRLEREMLRQEVASVSAPPLRHNLPASAASFVGRERELSELDRLLRRHRLVTITGLGGAGKTRLALEVAARQLENWTHGVWLADLTALADQSLVPRAIAETLEVEEPERLVEELRGRELLLVLDNCEHVIDECAAVVDRLLRGCPNIRVLATSRTTLGLPGGCDFALEPLAASAAVELFVDRASAVRRDLEPDDEMLVEVDAICRELEGLPLAIELAAARTRVLSLAEIAARLDDRFRFLRAWQRVADPRHRTLETTMDWSYELLEPEEQTLLRGMSVFFGGAELDAVAAVHREQDEHRMLELVERLVDASLVRAETAAPARYRLLETVRQYAAAKLNADPSATTIHRRHAEHFLRVAEAANLSIASLGTGRQQPELVLRDQHNVRAALDWAAKVDPELGVRLALALENFWVTQAPAEGAARFELLLERARIDDVLRAHALRDYAACFDVQQQFDRACDAYTRSRDLFARAGDVLGVANLEFRLGVMAVSRDGDVQRARHLWNRCLETFQAEQDVIGEIQALGNLGGVELRHGDPVRGRALVEQAAATARELGWTWWEGRAHASLAQAAVETGHAAEAEAPARAALEIARRTANWQEAVLALALLARAAAARGDVARASALWSSVEATDDGPSRFGRFDRGAFAQALADIPRVAPLPLDEAVDLALSS